MSANHPSHDRWVRLHPEKIREYQRRYYYKNLEKERERTRKWRKKHPDWDKEWRRKNPDKAKAIRERYLSKPANAIKSKKASERWRKSPRGKNNLRMRYIERYSNPKSRIKYLINSARHRCKSFHKGKVSFNSDTYKHTENPPKKCACCGKLFDYTVTQKTFRNSSSPSLDRIDPKKGYSFRNVAIICWQCNHVKGGATLKEMKMFVRYVSRELKHRR